MSRYLLALRPCADPTMATAWAALWEVFGAVGLPEALLCAGAFAARGAGRTGLSWFEARRLRLGGGRPPGGPTTRRRRARSSGSTARWRPNLWHPNPSHPPRPRAR
ncbi:MAG: hypothetical protein IRY99_26375 [Isosphaeraceae bacterium]|nr:hypothetical protein [Isosphaeraceae bacterium]